MADYEELEIELCMAQHDALIVDADGEVRHPFCTLLKDHDSAWHRELGEFEGEVLIEWRGDT